MVFKMPELFPSVTCGVAGIVAAVVIVKLSRRSKLDAIPTAGTGNSSPAVWWAPWGGLNHIVNGVDAIQEGCNKYKSAPFKIYDHFQWVVIVSNPKHIEQVLRAPEEVVSVAEAKNELFSAQYILGRGILDMHTPKLVIRSWLARNFATLYPETRDEISVAFDEELDLQSDEWKDVPALNLGRRVVCRTSNRLYVGLPLGRNPDWIDLGIQFSSDFPTVGALLGMLPESMRSLAVCFLPIMKKHIKCGAKHLEPIIEERLRYFDVHGDEDPSMPKDILSSLLKNGGDLKLRPNILASVLLTLNFAAIQNTSRCFTQALFHLVANPQHIQPLREEVESIVKKEGWSKEALDKMRKVDSLLRECQRFEGVTTVPIVRKVLKDFMLSDGTLIPNGTLVGVTPLYVHHEDKFYDNANVFQPFRFAEKHAEDEDVMRNKLTSVAINYLPFGLGRLACPGRFFASNVLKTMLAHVIITYDIKLEDGMMKPRSLHLGTAIVPDPRAKVLFRRRVG